MKPMSPWRLEEYRQRPHWSFSQLNTFISICSLRYAFQHVFKAEHEFTSVNLVFGKAFHAVAEWIARQRKAGIAVTVAETEELFSEYWKVESKAAENVRYESESQKDVLDATGRKMAICLLESWPVDEEVIEVSMPFCVPVIAEDGTLASEKPIIGEIDCVVKNPRDGVVILDWKSAARRWPADKAVKDLQATCFTFAYTIKQNLNPKFRFDVVTKAKTPSYEQHCTERTADDFSRLVQMICVMEKAVKAEVFMPNMTSFYCDDCSFQGSCREWHRCKSKVYSFGKAA